MVNGADISFLAPGEAECQGWCDKLIHCQNPQCSSCPLCGKIVACAPISKDDLRHESCEQWCKPEHKGAHCKSCACRSCGFCDASTAAEGRGHTTPVECAPQNKDDLPYEACTKWCKLTYKDIHCVNCACKQCGFCTATSTPAGTSPAPLGMPTAMQDGQSSKQCTPVMRDDASVESCKSYCKRDHSAAHCARCDCKACNFCSATELGECSPFNAADSSVEVGKAPLPDQTAPSFLSLQVEKAPLPDKGSPPPFPYRDVSRFATLAASKTIAPCADVKSARSAVHPPAALSSSHAYRMTRQTRRLPDVSHSAT